MDASTDYNIPDFERPGNARLGGSMPARIGEPAPHFEALRLDGGTVGLDALRGSGHVVLMLGSLTSPMTAIHVPAMNQLHAKYAPVQVNCYLVYVRESHPGEHFPHHASLEQKLSHARELQRLEDIRFPILVDSLDGAIHRAYGLLPTALFVVHRDGRLVYRASIANPADLGLYLDQLTAWDRWSAEHPGHRPHTTYSERLLEHGVDEDAHFQVYERAGPKAFEDYWRVFPDQRERWPRGGGVQPASSSRV